MNRRKPSEIVSETPAAPKIEDLLCAVSITLPSKGKTYGDLIPGGVISIKPPSTNEVEFFVEMNGPNYEKKLTQLLQMLIVEPVGLNPDKLTSGDRTFLHVWTRAQLHDSYVINVVCPACGHYHQNYYYKLVNIPVVGIDPDLEVETELELPICKAKVTLRITTGEDDQAADKLIADGVKKWTAKRSVSIAKIDGNVIDYRGAAMWLGKKPGQDSIFIDAFQKKTYHGLDFVNAPFICTCNTESLIKLPFRPEFYFPSLPFERLVGDAVVSSSLRSGRSDTGDPSRGEDGVSKTTVAPATGN